MRIRFTEEQAFILRRAVENLITDGVDPRETEESGRDAAEPAPPSLTLADSAPDGTAGNGASPTP
jgi:hypothetical protein